MFYDCSSLASLDVSKWGTSSVADMIGTFYGCSSLPSLDVSGWDTSSVTEMGSMFYDCSSLASLDVSKWDTSKVTGMNDLFNGCSSLASLEVSSWNTSNVQYVTRMFKNCPSLQSIAIGPKWTKSLEDTGLPSTLYGAEGKGYALAEVPLGIGATYYTKAEYVPHGNPAGIDDDNASAPEASAAGRDSKSDAGSIQGTGSESGSPAANGQDETPLAA